jgi:hypothetical protein
MKPRDRHAGLALAGLKFSAVPGWCQSVSMRMREVGSIAKRAMKCLPGAS